MRSDGWFLSYGLLGLTQNGLIPVLMPLAASHGSAAGLTYAAFSLLGVAAPFLGTWADSTGRHRDLLIWGTASAGILLLGFDFAPQVLQILIAAGAGLGAMATTTAGNVLAIQGRPEAEWDARVAMLQRYISTGQVIGLAAAGFFARSLPGGGFILAGLALLAASGLAFRSAPGNQPRGAEAKPAPRPMFGGDAGVTGAHHRGHHLPWKELGPYVRVISRGLAHFLIVWLIAYPAMNGFATLFPVAMTRQFGMNPVWPSFAYALGVGASVLLYKAIGGWTHRVGGGRTLMGGLLMRLVILGILVAASLAQLSWTGAAALVAFALVQFVWPFLAVGANSLSVHLAPTARGESVGLFNAATSLAAAVGSALAGPIFSLTGFAGLSATTFITIAAALVLCVFWLREWEAHPPSQAEPPMAPRS